MKRLLITLLFLSFSLVACGQQKKEKGKQKEMFYEWIFARSVQGQTELVLKDKSRVDVVTDTFAIEVEFASKWAESIGQSLYYAQMLNKKPGIVLIVNGQQENRYIFRLLTVTRKYGITVWILDYNTNKFGRTK